MHLNRLVLRNFKKYRRADITFQDGLTGIIGGNGAGKSTIVEAIAWALYGSKASTVERKFIKNVNARPEEPVEVHLTLSIGKKEIIISRIMKGGETRLEAVRTRVLKLDGDILKVEEELSELGFDPDEYNRLRAEAARLAEIESIANNLRVEIAGEDLSRSRMLEAEADLRRLHAKADDLRTRLEDVGYTDSAYENAKIKLSDAEEMLRRTNEEYARMRDELRRLEWNLSDLNEDLKRKRDRTLSGLWH